MKYSKHLLVLMAAFVLLGAIMMPTAKAATVAEGTCGQDLTWVLDDTGTLTISGNGPMADITAGNAPWAANSAAITAVVIQQGVTRIGAYSFQNCTALVSVSIANTVTTIGDFAFSGCTKLTTIGAADNIPAPPSTTAPSTGATTAPTAAPTTTPTAAPTTAPTAAPTTTPTAAPTTAPTAAPTTAPTVPSTTAGIQTTSLRAALKNHLPAVTSIGKSAFAGCTSLTDLIIPAGITTIESNTFSGCTALKDVTIPTSVTAIAEGAFAGCTGLKTVNYSGEPTQFAAIALGADNAELSRAYTQTLCDHTWDAGAVTREPNCTVEGITTFTCSICNGTKEEPIATNGVHVFGPWGEINDNKHRQVCTLCQHEELGVHTWDGGVPTVEATCAKKGVLTYTCSVCDGKLHKDIAKLTYHTYDNDCDISCNVCGLLRRTVHQYTTVYETNGTHHWLTCTVCQNKRTQPHVWNKDNICKTCGADNPNPHVHSFGVGWLSDSENHWHVCICEEKSDVGAHTWNSDNMCSVCGTEKPAPQPTEPATTTPPPAPPATFPVDIPTPTEPAQTPLPEIDFPIWILVVLLVISAGGIVAFIVILKKFG